MDNRCVDVHFDGTTFNLVPHRKTLAFLEYLQQDQTKYDIQNIYATSSGALMALSYILNISITIPTNINFRIYAVDLVIQHLEDLLDTNCHERLQNKLHIAFYRLKKGTCRLEWITKNTFFSKQDVIQTIANSMSIPFLTSKIRSDSDFYYFDGVATSDMIPRRKGNITIISESDSILGCLWTSNLTKRYTGGTQEEFMKIKHSPEIRVNKTLFFIQIYIKIIRFWYNLMAIFMWLGSMCV